MDRSRESSARQGVPRVSLVTMRWAWLLALPFVFFGCGSGGGGGQGDAVETFSNDGIAFTTATERTGTAATTAVTDDSGELVLTLTLTTQGVTINFPGETSATVIDFSEPLESLPSNYAANRLAVFIAGGLASDGGTMSLTEKDSPGCDWFPDTQCTLGCCAQHDICFDQNGCTASSWLPFVGSEACDNCNSVAASCISRACAGVSDSATDNRCYDNRCDMFYDCGGANCDCTSPCDAVSPSGCGNGSCELGETEENCPGDCVEGAGVNQCCSSTNNCPSETPTTCPGSCCCCGLGEVCQPTTVRCGPG